MSELIEKIYTEAKDEVVEKKMNEYKQRLIYKIEELTSAEEIVDNIKRELNDMKIKMGIELNGE